MDELLLTVASEFLVMEDGVEDKRQGAVKRTLCPPGNVDPLCSLVLAGRERRGALRPGKRVVLIVGGVRWRRQGSPWGWEETYRWEMSMIVLGFCVSGRHGEALGQPCLGVEGALWRPPTPLRCSAMRCCEPAWDNPHLDRDESENPVTIWPGERAYKRGLSNKSSRMFLMDEFWSLTSGHQSEVHSWTFLLNFENKIPTRLVSLSSLMDAHPTGGVPFLLTSTLNLNDIDQLHWPQPALQTLFVKALEANRCSCGDNEKVCK